MAKEEKEKGNWVSKLKGDVSDYFKAKKNIRKMKKTGKKIKKRMAVHNKGKTERTSGIEARLRKSGMSDAQIKRLRGN